MKLGYIAIGCANYTSYQGWIQGQGSGSPFGGPRNFIKRDKNLAHVCVHTPCFIFTGHLSEFLYPPLAFKYTTPPHSTIGYLQYGIFFPSAEMCLPTEILFHQYIYHLMKESLLSVRKQCQIYKRCMPFSEYSQKPGPFE